MAVRRKRFKCATLVALRRWELFLLPTHALIHLGPEEVVHPLRDGDRLCNFEDVAPG